LEHNEFLSTSTRPIDARVSTSPHAVKAFISTNDDAVLPPGSGVVFQWARGTPQLLQNAGLAISELPEGSPLPPEVDLPRRRIATDNSGDPLVEVTGLAVLDAYLTLGILEGRRMLVRSGVHERLVAANRRLPEGFTLILLDGWRSAATQRHLIEYYAPDAVEKQYVADLSDFGMRAPHLTGGAVDLTLCWRGQPLALGTDFDSFDVTAHSNAFEGVDSVTRRLRRMLFSAMSSAGFVPYPYEWWHWSYGDDVWAATVGATRSLYECIESEGR
jgi:D-alanyl-D-alanine dipeptidase